MDVHVYLGMLFTVSSLLSAVSPLGKIECTHPTGITVAPIHILLQDLYDLCCSNACMHVTLACFCTVFCIIIDYHGKYNCGTVPETTIVAAIVNYVRNSIGKSIHS